MRPNPNLKFLNSKNPNPNPNSALNSDPTTRALTMPTAAKAAAIAAAIAAAEAAAVAAAQERAVYDDSGDADDSHGVDSEDTTDDDSAEDVVAAQGATAPLSQPAVAAPSPPPTTRAASSFDPAISNPNPVTGPPHSQNGNASAAAAVNEAVDGSALPAVPEERRPATMAYDESRRLFQRLWTDDDEIKILQGFLEFTTRRGTAFASHQYDTGPFYEDIKKQLQLEFSKNQLIEKLRRLKKKYRTCVGRMNAAGDGFSFRSTHEKAIFDIARNIWSASVKRSHDSDDDINAAGAANSNEIFTVPVNEGPLSCERGFSRSRRRSKRRHTVEAAAPPPHPAAAAAAAVVAIAPETAPTAADASDPAICTPLEAVARLPSIVEETMKSCLSPLFKELINSAITSQLGGPAIGGGATAAMLNVLPLGLGSSPMMVTGTPMDEKWRAQQILELEVYLKRIEFVREQVKATLEELKSSPS